MTCRVYHRACSYRACSDRGLSQRVCSHRVWSHRASLRAEAHRACSHRAWSHRAYCHRSCCHRACSHRAWSRRACSHAFSEKTHMLFSVLSSKFRLLVHKRPRPKMACTRLSNDSELILAPHSRYSGVTPSDWSKLLKDESARLQRAPLGFVDCARVP